MTYQEIINNSQLNKTNKAKALFDLGYTRREVADLVLNGNYGFAQNIFVKHLENRLSTSLPHSPTSFVFNRTFGIEIEAYGANKNDLYNAIKAKGVAVEIVGYNHTTVNYWKITTDASINGDNGFEVVSPVLKGQNGLDELQKVCAALEQVGAKINKSCGLHVHIGVADFTIENWRNLYTNYATLEGKIDAIMPHTRRDNANQYCRSIATAMQNINLNECQTLKEIQLKVTHSCRYFKINTQCYVKYGTVEFRQHSGTIDFEKISNWVLFVAQLIDASKKVGKVQNFNDFCSAEVQQYCTQRAASLA